MDRETRDSYRKVIEGLARSTGQSEQEGHARSRQAWPREFQASTDRTAHVGYYLVDAGRAQLEARLGYHPAWRERLRRRIFRHPTRVYWAAMALISLAIFAGRHPLCYEHRCNSWAMDMGLACSAHYRHGDGIRQPG